MVMPTNRGLASTSYNAEERMLVLTYQDGSIVRVKNVSLERASRLQSRAAAEAKRGVPTGFFFHR